MTDYIGWLTQLTDWAADEEFRRIRAHHAAEGGGVAAARLLIEDSKPQIRARLESIRDEQIAPLLARTTSNEEHNQLAAGMVLFTREAEALASSGLAVSLAEAAQA